MNDPDHRQHGDHDSRHAPQHGPRRPPATSTTPAITHGHGDHGGHGDHVGQFRRLFWIMLILAVPVVGFSGMFSMLLGYSLPAADWVGWISPLLGTVMYVWGGRPFLTGAVDELPAPTARDDAAHRVGHHGGLHRLLGRQSGHRRTTSSTSGGSWRC